MRKFLIFYNLIFLLGGNLLFANTHYLHDHDHHHDHVNSECEECINFSNGHHYTLVSNDITVLKHQTVLFAYEYFSIIEFSDTKIYLSRAPPLSPYSI
jgi:hypothetical protein